MLPIRDVLSPRTKPLATWLLILINIAVYLATLYNPLHYIESYGFVPSLALRDPYRLITHMFLHGGFIHLAGNMLFLWVFGPNVEDRMGRAKFLPFYLSCGLAAALFHALTTGNPSVTAIGASGAISGILGAYLFYFPKGRIVTVLLFPIVVLIQVPAYFYIGVWLVYQLAYGVLRSFLGELGGTAYFAHIGGFLFGLLTVAMAELSSKAFSAR